MNVGVPDTTPRAPRPKWSWYPYVVAIYPLWFLYLTNLGQASLGSVLWVSAFAIAFTFLLLTLVRWCVGSRQGGALITTVLLGAFYAYGPLHDLAVRLAARESKSQALQVIGMIFENHHSLSLLLLGVLIVVIWLILSRVDLGSTRLAGACNFAAGTLGAILLLRVMLAAGSYLTTDPSQEPKLSKAGNDISVLGYNPDIYYIILDGYARADVLREYYGFDNSAFIAGLQQRGFAVTDHSYANYNYTFLSLASSLNFDYLQSFAADLLADPGVREGREGFGRIARLLQDNRAAHFLRDRGYRFVHLQSSSPETVRNPYADEQVTCAGRLFDDEYFRAVSEMSWLKALPLRSMVTDDLAECHRLRLKSLADQARRSGPKFVFAHFLPPHHPYLFDRSGNVLRKVTISNQFDFQAKLWEDKSGYLEQLLYMNSSMLELIDSIRAQSQRPPIVIIQSDHGPNLRKGLTEQQAQSLRLANFAAYFLPGASPGTLPNDCAPVNQFRYLFNHYFAAGFPILPSKSYFSEFNTPLQMSEITHLTPDRGLP